MMKVDEFHKSLLIGAAFVSAMAALAWLSTIELGASIAVVALFFAVTTVLAYRERNASLTIMQAVMALLFSLWAFAAWGRT
jgi:hypothetical protein